MGDVQVFLVRVWQHMSQFRASVRGIGEDEPRLFDEPQRLSEYLRAASEASSAAPPGRSDPEPNAHVRASEGNGQRGSG
jgi:hypothetical protein